MRGPGKPPVAARPGDLAAPAGFFGPTRAIMLALRFGALATVLAALAVIDLRRSGQATASRTAD